jgi:hypothetical protein
MINDAHCHFFSSRFLELLAPDAGGAESISQRLQWDPPKTAAELGDRWLAELERDGVSRAALIASVPGDAASVAEAVAHHPDRFVGFFMHNPMAPGADILLARALKELHMRTICLFPAMHGYHLDDERVEMVFRAATEHGAAVFAHCGLLTVGVRAKMALAVPDVPVIVPHFGAGFFREALMAADQCPTIHFDTSSSNSWIRFDGGLSLEGVFKSALSVVGATRLLFGTDSSWFPRGWQQGIYEEQQRIMGTLGVSVADRTAIFGGNFDRLFPL